MSALEAELNEALEDTVQLEERNNQLTQQLSALREKVSVRPRAPQLIQQEPRQSTTHTDRASASRTELISRSNNKVSGLVAVFSFSGRQTGLGGDSAESHGRGAEELGCRESGPPQPTGQS